MASLCREFGISRKTDYKIVDRYAECGLGGSRIVRGAHNEGTPLSPNAFWCSDYKGEFELGNRRYCYPPTVTDHASRFLLLRGALEFTQEQFAFTTFRACSRARLAASDPFG